MFEQKKGIRKYIGPKRFVFLCFLIGFVIAVRELHQSGLLTPNVIENYKANYPYRSIIFFILIYALSVIACLPSLPLNLAAGFFWGGLLGGIFSALGVTLGGLVAFTFARSIFGRPLIMSFKNKWLDAVRIEFASNGWKLVAFARINPIIPSGPLNYFLGLTSLSSSLFIFLSIAFLLPPSIAVAFIGDTFKTFSAQQSEVRTYVNGILLISAVLTFLFVIRFVPTFFKQKSDK